MADAINRLTVFVGSPSDCKREREVVGDLIPNINRDLQTLGMPIEFSFVSWEEGVFPDAGRPQDIINEKLDKADIVLLVFWYRFGTDAGHSLTGTEEEFQRALERRHREGVPRVLLYFKECPLPYHVDLDQLSRLRKFRRELETRAELLAGSFQQEEEFKQQARLAFLDEGKKWTAQANRSGTSRTLATPESATSWSERRNQLSEVAGFSSIQRVFGGEELTGRVFAVELLTQPQQLMYRDRQKIVRLNRRHTTDAIYTGAARRKLRDLSFDTPEVVQWAQQADEEIHEFLRGKHKYDLELPLDKCPLRWASGGVFPVVSYRGRSWTSFFFRDIWPEGWNLSLGASEPTDNLQDPWSFLWREFLEELLVLRTAPEDLAEQAIERRRPIFADNPDLRLPARSAQAFSADHIKLRAACDGMRLPVSEDHPLRLDTHPTDTILEISGTLGASLFSNVFFVTINPRELGIEIVVPVSYSLDDNDYLLDGEILKPEGGEEELVRMPVALISHEYLRRSFGDLDRPLQYDDENQASVIGADLNADDIVIFDWDVRRRLAIANGTSGRGTELERCQRWRERFGLAFQNAQETGLFSKQLQMFTAPSAKIASYYFS